MLPYALARHVLVHPVRVSPHARVYLSKLNWGTGEVRHSLLERRVEVPVIQEHVGIVEPPVEVPFDGFDGLNDTLQFLVASEHHERRIRSWTVRVWVLTSGYEDTVIFLADSSARRMFGKLWILVKAEFTQQRQGEKEWYLIGGGAPAGIRILPGEEGCRTKTIKISIITMNGNRRTNPKGIEMPEFPLSLIRRRKKARRGDSRSP